MLLKVISQAVLGLIRYKQCLLSYHHHHHHCLQEYYGSRNINYMGLKMFDVPQTNIAKFFNEAADFIDAALKNNGEEFTDYHF